MLRLLDTICGIVDVWTNIFFVVILCLGVPSWFQGPLLLGIFASVFHVLGDLPTLPASVTIFVSNLMTFGGMMLLYFVGISLYTGFLFRLPSFLHGWGVLALFFGSCCNNHHADGIA